jgi:hypothetical protein
MSTTADTVGELNAPGTVQETPGELPPGLKTTPHCNPPTPPASKVSSLDAGDDVPDRVKKMPSPRIPQSEGPQGILDIRVSPRPSPRVNAEDDGGVPLLNEGKGKQKQSGLFNFANAEAIKDKVRAAKHKPPPYNVHDMYHAAGFFQWLAKHPLFENVTLSIIVVNALWISIDTDGNTADTILTAKPVYVAADIMFFTYFSVELIVRFLAFKKKCSCTRDGWFVFDSTLVTLYAFDPFIIGLMAALSGGGGLNLPTAVLRLFRLARLSRLVRMLRSLPELMIMIKGMVSAAASVGYTLGLLLLITYVFSIALRNLTPERDPELPEDEDISVVYFSTVPEAMHNLIIFGTFLDALSDFIINIKNQSIPCFILSWLYISLASLTVMNMLIGVLCEVISAVAEEEKESMMVDKVNEKFSHIVSTLDTNNDGTLSWEEFQKILDCNGALRALESVNVDPESMVDMAEDFFFEDGEPVQVTFTQFMDMVLDLRGGQQATVENIMSLAKRFNKKFLKLRERLDTVEEACGGIDDKLDTLLKKKADAKAKAAAAVAT